QGRATEMRAALLVFLDHPALGVGPDGFPLFYEEYAQRAGGYVHTRDRATGEVPQRAAHNFLLGIAAELGIAGVVAFVAIILATVRALLRARRCWLNERPDLEALATGMLVALGGYLAAGLFLSLAYERYFWLLMGLAAAAATALRPEEAVERPVASERTGAATAAPAPPRAPAPVSWAPRRPRLEPDLPPGAGP
ncbi:MAG: O-antigen ligase family protein, partial [Actinomycetota bacterium]|nr:O-antigen ligase family protein [Actinomycetota bacterium]